MLTNGIGAGAEEDVLKQLQKEEEGHQSDDRKSDTSELRKLQRRKVELERSNKMQEKRHERYQVSNNSSFECRKMFQVPIKWTARIYGDCHKTDENWTAKNYATKTWWTVFNFRFNTTAAYSMFWNCFCWAFGGHSEAFCSLSVKVVLLFRDQLEDVLCRWPAAGLWKVVTLWKFTQSCFSQLFVEHFARRVCGQIFVRAKAGADKLVSFSFWEWE